VLFAFKDIVEFGHELGEFVVVLFHLQFGANIVHALTFFRAHATPMLQPNGLIGSQWATCYRE
jgi:hypothetical protein